MRPHFLFCGGGANLPNKAATPLRLNGLLRNQHAVVAENKGEPLIRDLTNRRILPLFSKLLGKFPRGFLPATFLLLPVVPPYLLPKHSPFVYFPNSVLD